MTTCINELEGIVRRHFAFLLLEGFNVSFSSEWRSGEYCVLILSSPQRDYKIKFTYEMGFVNIFLGPADAPDRLEDRGWFYIKNVLDFLEGRGHSLEETFAFDKRMRMLDTDEKMRYWSTRLKKKETAIQTIFADATGRKVRSLMEYIHDRGVLLEKEFRKEQGGKSKA